MKSKFELHEAVQFNENHKWCGVIGFISEITDLVDDVRYMVAVPKIPTDEEIGTAPTYYIFVSQNENTIESLHIASSTGRLYTLPPLTI